MRGAIGGVCVCGCCGGGMYDFSLRKKPSDDGRPFETSPTCCMIQSVHSMIQVFENTYILCKNTLVRSPSL